MTAVNVSPQQATISIKAYLGPPTPNQQNAIYYLSPDTLTGSVQDSYTYSLAATTNYQALALATVFPACVTPVIVTLSEVTTVPLGFSITTVSGSGNNAIQPGGIFCWTPNVLATIYVSNTNSSAIVLQARIIYN